jgi:hypothetical protein
MLWRIPAKLLTSGPAFLIGGVIELLAYALKQRRSVRTRSTS